MISVMQLVLNRTTARWSKSWSEAQFEMVIFCVFQENLSTLLPKIIEITARLMKLL